MIDKETTNKRDRRASWRRNGLIVFWVISLVAFIILVIVKLLFLIEMWTK